MKNTKGGRISPEIDPCNNAYKIHTVLTDNGTHFTEPSGDGWTPEDIIAMRAQKMPFRCHAFEAACADLGIKHRLTKPRPTQQSSG